MPSDFGSLLLPIATKAAEICLQSIAETAASFQAGTPSRIRVEREHGVEQLSNQTREVVGAVAGLAVNWVAKGESNVGIDNLMNEVRDELLKEGNSAVFRDVMEEPQAVGEAAVESIRNQVIEKWRLSEGKTADALTSMIGQRLMGELSKPAFLRNAELQAARRNITPEAVLEEELVKYQQSIAEALRQQDATRSR